MSDFLLPTHYRYCDSQSTGERYSDKQITHPPKAWAHQDLRLLAYHLSDNKIDVAARSALSDYDTQVTACVLLALTNEACPKLLLTKRSSNLSSHAGEVSLVGGRRDKTDTSTVHTALREAFEEVRLPCDRVSIIGYLPLQVSAKGLFVRPVVGLIDPSVSDELMPSADEIARLFWGNLDEFKKVPTDYTVAYADCVMRTPAWQIQGEMVWGLTGRVIASLLAIGFGVHYEWYYQRL